MFLVTLGHTKMSLLLRCLFNMLLVVVTEGLVWNRSPVRRSTLKIRCRSLSL